MTEDEILKELQEARVSKVVRICKSQNGVKIPTSSVKLFFDSSDITDKVHVGWRSFKVKEYRANRLRCYICSRFGHKAASCHARKPRCARCRAGARVFCALGEPVALRPQHPKATTRNEVHLILTFTRNALWAYRRFNFMFSH